MSCGSFAQRLAATFSDGPLDGSRISREISHDIPGLHAKVRAQEFHARLARIRREAREQARNSSPSQPAVEASGDDQVADGVTDEAITIPVAGDTGRPQAGPYPTPPSVDVAATEFEFISGAAASGTVADPTASPNGPATETPT